jgi:hypothetical protein
MYKFKPKFKLKALTNGFIIFLVIIFTWVWAKNYFADITLTQEYSSSKDTFALEYNWEPGYWQEYKDELEKNLHKYYKEKKPYYEKKARRSIQEALDRYKALQEGEVLTQNEITNNIKLLKLEILYVLSSINNTSLSNNEETIATIILAKKLIVDLDTLDSQYKNKEISFSKFKQDFNKMLLIKDIITELLAKASIHEKK